MKTQGLDYEIVIEEGGTEFQVWTPDDSGAVIGSGPTKESAITDAVVNMLTTISEMVQGK